TLGSALGPALAVAALATEQFRLAFVPIVVLLSVVAVLIHRQSHEPYARGWPVVDVRATASRLVGSPPIRRSLLAFAIVGFLWQGAINFIPTMLQVDRGFSPAAAGAVFAGLFVVGTVANIVAGHLGDRFGAPVVALAGIVTGFVGLAVLVLAEATWVVIIATLSFGFGVSAFWPVMDAFVMARLPDETAGGDFGALNTVNLATGSLGPVYVGLVAERASYTTAYAGFLFPFFLGFVVLWRLWAGNRHE
ncbi:MAG: MFS transporter, partial [Halobacteriales archaeon]|nr:MFS transporter [Halobacteriales archaeon]